MNIVKPEQTVYAKCLIYAPMGHGKTRFCGTAQLDERTKPSLFLDFEGGALTLSGLDIDTVRIRSRSDFLDVYDEIRNNTDKYKSISIDSISEVEFGDLIDIIDSAKERRPEKDHDLIQQGDYGKGHVRLQRLVRQFRDLPYHIFVTAGSQDVLEARVGIVKKPQLTGKMADQIPAVMDVVGYLGIREENGQAKRALMLQGFSDLRVKVRLPWDTHDVPDQIEEPTVGKLLDALHYGARVNAKR